MAVRSILEIDVQSDALTQALRIIGNINQAIKAQQGAWDKVGPAIEAVIQKERELQNAAAIYNRTLREAAEHTSKLSVVGSTVGGFFRTIAGYTGSIAKDILGATERLLKWTGIFGAVTGAIGGLAGYGSLHGIEDLAGEASAGRRSSMALGLPYGTLQAFEATVGGRYVNANSFLSNVATGLSDITSTQYRALLTAGLRPGQLQNEDTGQVALQALPAIQRLLQRTNPAFLGPMMEATGLSSILSLGEARTLRATPTAELANTLRQTQREQQALTLPPETLKKWQDLNVQLDLAGRNIRTSLIDGLSGLTGPLQRLSDAFSKVISAFLRSDEVKKLIGSVADGLNHLADYLQKPEFGQAVESFEKKIGELATYLQSDDFKQKVGRFIGDIEKMAVAIDKFINWVSGNPVLTTLPDANDTWKQKIPPANHFNIDPLGDMMGWWQSHAPSWLGGWSQGKIDFLKAIEPGEGGGPGYYSKLGGGSISGLPSDPFGYPIGAGAAGAYQFRQSTWDEEAKKLGLHDFSPHSQNLAAWDLAATRFQQATHRSLEDALNVGDIDDVIRVLKGTWTSFDNPTVQARLHQAFSHRGDQNKHAQKDARVRSDMRQNMKFDVRNQTGSGVMITGGALAGAYGP